MGRHHIYRCNCTYLLSAADAKYVEDMNSYLFDGNGEDNKPPILSSWLWGCKVTYEPLAAAEARTCWSIVLEKGRVVSADDFSLLRRKDLDGNRVRLYEEGSRSPLCVPWRIFPGVP